MTGSGGSGDRLVDKLLRKWKQLTSGTRRGAPGGAAQPPVGGQPHRIQYGNPLASPSPISAQSSAEACPPQQPLSSLATHASTTVPRGASGIQSHAGRPHHSLPSAASHDSRAPAAPPSQAGSHSISSVPGNSALERPTAASTSSQGQRHSAGQAALTTAAPAGAGNNNVIADALSMLLSELEEELEQVTAAEAQLSTRHKLVASLIEALPGGGITTPGPDRGGSNTTVMGGMAQRLHAESERVGDELRVAQDRAQVLKYARTQWTSMLDMMRGVTLDPASAVPLQALIFRDTMARIQAFQEQQSAERQHQQQPQHSQGGKQPMQQVSGQQGPRALGSSGHMPQQQLQHQQPVLGSKQYAPQPPFHPAGPPALPVLPTPEPPVGSSRPRTSTATPNTCTPPPERVPFSAVPHPAHPTPMVPHSTPMTTPMATPRPARKPPLPTPSKYATPAATPARHYGNPTYAGGQPSAGPTPSSSYPASTSYAPPAPPPPQTGSDGSGEGSWNSDEWVARQTPPRTVMVTAGGQEQRQHYQEQYQDQHLYHQQQQYNQHAYHSQQPHHHPQQQQQSSVGIPSAGGMRGRAHSLADIPAATGASNYSTSSSVSHSRTSAAMPRVSSTPAQIGAQGWQGSSVHQGCAPATRPNTSMPPPSMQQRGAGRGGGYSTGMLPPTPEDGTGPAAGHYDAYSNPAPRHHYQQQPTGSTQRQPGPHNPQQASMPVPQHSSGQPHQQQPPPPAPTVGHFLRQGQAAVTPFVSAQQQPEAAGAAPASSTQDQQPAGRPVGYLDFSDIPGFGEGAPDSQAFASSCLQFARASILSQQNNTVDAPRSRRGARDQNRAPQEPFMAPVTSVPELGASVSTSQHGRVSNTGPVSSTATSTTNTASTRSKSRSGLTKTERSTYRAALNAIKHSAAFAGVCDRLSASGQALPSHVTSVIMTTSTATGASAAVAAVPAVNEAPGGQAQQNQQQQAQPAPAQYHDDDDDDVFGDDDEDGDDNEEEGEVEEVEEEEGDEASSSEYEEEGKESRGGYFEVPSERFLQPSNTAASAALSGAHALQSLTQDGQDVSSGPGQHGGFHRTISGFRRAQTLTMQAQQACILPGSIQEAQAATSAGPDTACNDASIHDQQQPQQEHGEEEEEAEMPAASSMKAGQLKKQCARTLYDKLGGAAAIEAAVSIFYSRILSDPLLAPFFEGVCMRAMAKKQVLFLSYAFGGLPEYDGKMLAAAHEHLIRDKGLNLTHFDAVASHFVAALNQLCVDEADTEEAVKVLLSVRHYFDPNNRPAPQ